MDTWRSVSLGVTESITLRTGSGLALAGGARGLTDRSGAVMGYASSAAVNERLFLRQIAERRKRRYDSLTDRT